jgi:HEAT repeat protein
MVRRCAFGGLVLLLLLVGCQQRGPIDLESLKGRARAGDATAFRELIGLLSVAERQLNDKVYPLILELGDPAIPFLLESVNTDDRIRREHVIAALGTLKVAQAVAPIGRVLGDRSLQRRYIAAWSLGEIGDPRGIPFLLAALGDDEGEVQRYAVRALIKINREAVVPLLVLLETASARATSAAVRALGDIGDSRALSALLQRVDGPARQEVLHALGKLKDPRAEAALIDGLLDADWQSRMNAAMSLGALGGPAAAVALEQAVEDEVLVVREWAARSLEMISGSHVKYRNEQGEYVLPYSIYH